MEFKLCFLFGIIFCAGRCLVDSKPVPAEILATPKFLKDSYLKLKIQFLSIALVSTTPALSNTHHLILSLETPRKTTTIYKFHGDPAIPNYKDPEALKDMLAKLESSHKLNISLRDGQTLVGDLRDGRIEILNGLIENFYQNRKVKLGEKEDFDKTYSLHTPGAPKIMDVTLRFTIVFKDV